MAGIRAPSSPEASDTPRDAPVDPDRAVTQRGHRLVQTRVEGPGSTRLGAGVWTQYGHALAEPCGRVHWAGAETADVWNGYVEGAVRSGRRAAAEVLGLLG
ncbi:FAD-dependent oxidoreductase [Streptomyces sp. NPDC003435]